MRASRVTGPSSSGVPWCNTPPDSTLPRPYFSLRRSTDGSPSPSREKERSASGTNIVFEATHPRPTRSCAYASPASLPRPSPGSLPARAGSPLAGRNSHPLDSKRSFKESSQFLLSQSTSRAWSHSIADPRLLSLFEDSVGQRSAVSATIEQTEKFVNYSPGQTMTFFGVRIFFPLKN